ncbi:MAG TPA: hypothetical protein VGM58_07075 [Verrucomicrobiae bacterium]|jgi:hypothetical protein
MSDKPSSEAVQTRFGELVGGFKTKLPRKLALLFPFKTQIEGLLAKQASYDDIRLLLEDVSVVVSKNTVYRFCRQVIGQKSVRQYGKTGTKEISPLKISPVSPPPESIQTALQEQRARFPGPWSRRKRGPRIADSKNL